MNSPGVKNCEASDLNSTKISVLIVNWNQKELTQHCIEIVLRSIQGINFEIVLVDNGSNDTNRISSVNASRPIRYIFLNQNLFFGEANNIAAEAACGEFLLFLNNDVEIRKGAVEGLLKVFESERFAGAVGPKFLFPDGTLQEAGAFIRPDGWTFQQGKYGTPIDKKFTSGNHIVDYCSAACLLLRRSDFLNIGGFDALFEPAYFEDVDLALRLRSAGLYSYFCADIEVFHIEHGTSSSSWSPAGLNEITVQSHDKFFDRWKSYLQARPVVDHTTQARHVEASESERSYLGRIIFCISTTVRISEECDTVLRLAAALAERFEIYIAASEACSRIRILARCRNLGIALENFQILRFDPDILSHYDYVLFGSGWKDRNDAPFLSQFPNSTVVLERLLNSYESAFGLKNEAGIDGKL